MLAIKLCSYIKSCSSLLAVPSVCVCVIRLHCMQSMRMLPIVTNVVWSLVCLSVGHSHEPFQNAWSDRRRLDMDLGGTKKPCVRVNRTPLREGAVLVGAGHLPTHYELWRIYSNSQSNSLASMQLACVSFSAHANYYYYTRLTAFFPGQPG